MLNILLIGLLAVNKQNLPLPLRSIYSNGGAG